MTFNEEWAKVTDNDEVLIKQILRFRKLRDMYNVLCLLGFKVVSALHDKRIIMHRINIEVWLETPALTGSRYSEIWVSNASDFTMYRIRNVEQLVKYLEKHDEKEHNV